MDEVGSESNLELDPSVMTAQDTDQAIESIDSKYGVSLFTTKDDEYTIYDYDKVINNMYATDDNYNINIDTNKVNSFFTKPVVYSSETSGIDIQYQSIVITILVIQILVVLYFVYRIIKVKGSKRERYNN